MNKVVVFLVFCICFVSIYGSEIFQDDKNLYKELLSEISLTRTLLESGQFVGNKAIKEARDEMRKALKNYESTLKSEKVINHFCGSTERVDGIHPGYRMLNIYRRDTRNPFAEKFTGRRMIRRKGVCFPGFSSNDCFDQWNELMDRDLVHFSVDKFAEYADLDQVIEARCIEKVKDLVHEKFVERGGVLEDGGINYAKVRIIDLNYKSVFILLSQQ